MNQHLLTERKVSALMICGDSYEQKGLTVVAVVEDQELAPAELIDERQHDVAEAHGRPGGQRVASSVSARLERAGGARRAVVATLDVQVRDVHGVRERLQGAR